MNNLLKSKTRLAFIQVIFQHISTQEDIFEIFNMFNNSYKDTYVNNFHNKKKIKFEFNSNFLKKLITYYSHYISTEHYISTINNCIKFDRKFQKWDIINQSILIAAISELNKVDNKKIKIILNDYLNVSKSFINQSEIGIINAIIDRLINDKKL